MATVPPEYEFKTKPYSHQREEFFNTRDVHYWGHFWEQGTGKSKIVIDTACWLYMIGEIDAVIVVAPNGVHRNWITEEIPTHAPDNIQKFIMTLIYSTDKAQNKGFQKQLHYLMKHQGFSWIAVSYDAFVTKSAKKFLASFLDERKVLFVGDESHYIKNPDATRTKTLIKASRWAPYRRILSGTPISQGPFDTYSQVSFLSAKFWITEGFRDYKIFTKHFGEWTTGWNPRGMNYETMERTGAEYPVLVRYRRLDQLYRVLKKISSRVLKDDVLDLPPKVYTKRYFDMTQEQWRLYDELRTEFVAWVDGAPELSLGGRLPESDCVTCGGSREINDGGYIYPCPDCTEPAQLDLSNHKPVFANLAITRILRYQQVSSGFLPLSPEDVEAGKEPYHLIPGKNPRLDLLQEVVEGTPGKIIIWARFQLDITLILERMVAIGVRAVRYDGLVGESDRAEAVALFKGERVIMKEGKVVGREPVPEAKQARVFVANEAVGATGLTLVQAKTVIYYSNGNKLVNRLQSEDRSHRIGQNQSVLYIDLIANDTVDEKLVKTYREKRELASAVLGDEIKEWI